MAKKIGAIVSLSIIAILIVLTIITASVSVNHKIECENPQKIWVYTSGVEQGVEEGEHSKIVELIDDASKQNCLSAFFAGNLDATAEVVTEAGTVTIDKDKYYVRYHYAEEQDLKQGKSVYKDGDGKTYKYEDLLFEVQDTNGVATVKAYVVPDTNASAGLKYTHYYNVWADFSDLYNYLNSRF